MKYIVQIFLFVIIFFSQAIAAPVKSNVKDEQHKATVTIIIHNDISLETKGCSASAISEHVLLTAGHCDVDGGLLYLNQNKEPLTHPLEISEKFFDHQDHMLLVVPGVSFKHFIIYDPSVYKPIGIDEHWYFWGSPGMLLDQYREGYVTGRVTIDLEETREVDVISPFFMLSGPVIGGDSGSAVFASDGRIVGLLTYGVYGGQFAGIYSLAFTEDQVKQAEGLGNFVYVPNTKPNTNVLIVVPENQTKPDYSLSYLFAIFLFCYAVPGIYSMLKVVTKKGTSGVKLSLKYTWRFLKAIYSLSKKGCILLKKI